MPLSRPAGGSADASRGPRAGAGVAPPPAGPDARPRRFLTIDVEEYFHIEAARQAVPREQWEAWPSRVEASVEGLLELLGRQGVRGTFFVLGDVARRSPRLVGRIAAAGHEIASHGHLHDRLHRLDPGSFARDLDAARKLLEDQSGKPVRGYRAPTFSVVPATAWAVDVLLEAGMEYDASVFPVRHPAYGVPSAPDRPFLLARAPGSPAILEIPPLTLGLPWPGVRRKLGVAGGGYFRLLPRALMEMGLRQAARESRPAVLYFHPWEFDPGLPRMPLSRLGRLRTYTGLAAAGARLESILSRWGDGVWTPLGEALAELRAEASTRPIFWLTPAPAGAAPAARASAA